MVAVTDLMYTPFEELTFSIIDTETTGMNAKHNRIVDIAIISIKNNKIIDTWQSLINPIQDIPYWITNFTHIRNEHVKNKPTFDVLSELIYSKLVNTIVVGHNVGFDYAFLYNEFNRLGIKFVQPKLCTVLLSHTFLGHLPKFGLDTLIDYYHIEMHDRHRAYPDAYATALVFQDFLKKAKKEYRATTFYDLLKLQKTKKVKLVNTGENLFNEEF